MSEPIKLLEPSDRQPFLDNDVSITAASSNGPGGSSEMVHELLTKQMSAPGSNFALYEEDEDVDGAENEESPTYLAAYLKSFIGPMSTDDANGKTRRKAKLGVLIGVYLPTLQHIFGVIMFLRLFWIVGTAGVVQSFFMVFMCCFCTFLTSISMSAIATNGVVESGGSYFMISRNLGPEFGSAVGILFYLANAVATAMYLIGAIEVLLTYIAPPSLPQLKDPHDNNRIYGTLLLLVVFAIVALGVRFVQLFAPVTLSCVIISILAIYIGSLTANEHNSPGICMLGNRLLASPPLGNYTGNWCSTNQSGPLWQQFCSTKNETDGHCAYFKSHGVRSYPGIPGFASGVIHENAWPVYMSENEVVPGVLGQKGKEVVQDITTTFFVLLAIYFPSVTGIMTGSNMSGDLRDPQKSIPSGTIAAQLTTSVVYLSFVLIFGGTIKGALLRDKYGESLGKDMVVAQLAWPSKWVLMIGSFTSCFGAGLQCLCSAPRLLQSIAKDDVLPFLHVFSRVTKRNEPIRALLITTLIAESAILIGTIDHIAPVVDFFFLMCYAFVNIVCALQTLLKAPNWRPRFRFYHWSLSLFGALLCLFIMFATHWYYALVVIVLCASIYKYVEYKGAKKEWGDGIRGLALSTAQYSLLRVEDSDPHPKNWRPQILLLTKLDHNDDAKYFKLLELASQLKAGKGLTMVATLVHADYTSHDDRKRLEFIKKNLKETMKKAKVKGFANALPCNKLSENVTTYVLGAGIGGLKPNTVLVGWPCSWKDAVETNDSDYWDFLDAIHRVATAEKCLLIPKGIDRFPDTCDRLSGYIDVWWIIHDGGLLLLLPFLLKQHKVWRQCKLRVFAVAQMTDNSVKMKEDLKKCVYQLRIDATVHIVELPDSAVSAYTYQKTRLMETRSKAAMDLSPEEIAHEPQLLLDRHRTSKAEIFENHLGDLSITPMSTPVSKKVSLSKMAPIVKISMDDSPQGDIVNSPDTPTSPTGIFDNHLSLTADDDRSVSRISDDGASDVESQTLSSRTGTDAKKYYFTFTPKDMQREMKKAEMSHLSTVEDRKRAKKLHTAIKLNKIIVEQSVESKLVVINLPQPPRKRQGLQNYMEYVEVLTENLERVLLVRGTGHEVITIYS